MCYVPDRLVRGIMLIIDNTPYGYTVLHIHLQSDNGCLLLVCRLGGARQRLMLHEYGLSRLSTHVSSVYLSKDECRLLK